METLDLVQGSDAWLSARLSHFTASEAPIMMGASPHMSRDELLTYKTTQIQSEVSRFTQLIYDRGHELEAMARPIAERILGVDLYPVTGRADVEGLPLLASFDGLDLSEVVGFEHKQLNAQKAQFIDSENDLQPEYYWQLEHELLVSNADFFLFVMSDGTKDNWIQFEYKSVPQRRAALIAGWKQFQADLVDYVPAEYIPAPQGKALMELPALSIQLVGKVTGSNLAVYKDTALAFIDSINTDLQTDQDFADAEKTIKFCDGAEKELELVKKQALSQTADIDLLFRTVDELKESMRAKRLELNTLVESRKKAIRNEIVINAKTALAEHIAKLNKCLVIASIPPLEADFASAIKGKKTIKSLHEAANDELARVKIVAGQLADKMAHNIKFFTENDQYAFLFNDFRQIVLKETEDFKLLVSSRIDAHKKAEAEKLEAQRLKIEAETEARLRREAEVAEVKAKAEQWEAERLANDQARKIAMAEQSKPYPEELHQGIQAKAEDQDIPCAEIKQANKPEVNSDESEIVGFLYSQCKIYGEQGKTLARLLMANRVPCMRYEARKARAA